MPENLWIWIVLGVVLLGLAVGAALLAPRLTRRPHEPSAAERPAAQAPADDATTDATTTDDAAVDGTSPPTLPEASADVEVPVLDVPEPVTGRLARLRARLARSGSPLGARSLSSSVMRTPGPLRSTMVMRRTSGAAH